MILIINVCKERLHYLEFVKPIETFLQSNNIQCNVVHYHDINKKDLDSSSKVIICGTSLKDNQFVKDLDEFSWIKDYNKPILGICAGMQIISLIHGAKLKKKTEIGLYQEEFTEFLGLKSKQEVYHLHNNYTTLPKEFEKFTKSKIPQAIKHKSIYGVLFHPEVRRIEIIKQFISI